MIKNDTEECVSLSLLDKIPEKVNLKEERFTFAHGIRGVSQWLASSMALSLLKGKP